MEIELFHVKQYGGCVEILDREFERYLIAGLKKVGVWIDGNEVFLRNASSQDEPQNVFSVTKSVVGLMVGIVLKECPWVNLETKLPDLLPSQFERYFVDGKEKISLHHTLNQTTGIKWQETGRPWGESNTSYLMEQSDNWMEWLLSQSLSSEPGLRFNYNTGVSHLLVYICEHILQMEFEKSCNEFLFGPLGIKISEWKKDKQGHVQGGKGLYLNLQDMRKIGQLVLNNGEWNGNEIVDEYWIKVMLEPKSRGHIYYGTYGYHWWLRKTNPELEEFDIKCAIGYGGQFIFVVPKQKMVCTFQGNLIGENFGIPFEYLNLIINEIK